VRNGVEHTRARRRKIPKKYSINTKKEDELMIGIEDSDEEEETHN
jgi:hypothetical protein